MKLGRKRGISKYMFKSWYTYVPDGCLIVGEKSSCFLCPLIPDCKWEPNRIQKLKLDKIKIARYTKIGG